MLIKNATEKFEYCISLGWFCGVASAMSRLGLRSVSGPFDWYFSDYWAVLSQLENDFQEFMLRDNLRISATNCKGFEDVKYGFCYNHDIRENFEEEYSAIYQKYMRRVERFREMSTHPTVFFRCIKNQEEIEYINRHWQYAENLVKSRNENSRIIYVFCSSLKGLTQDVCQFCLNIEQYVSRTYEMRYMFDASEELLDMCKNLLSEEMIREKKNFDLKQNRQKRAAGNADRCARCDQEGLDDVILAGLGVSRTEGIYLWGGGKYGKTLADYLQKREVRIEGIVDNRFEEMKESAVRVISPQDLREGAKIFISVLSPEMNAEIEKQIAESGKSATVMRYQDIPETFLSSI